MSKPKSSQGGRWAVLKPQNIMCTDEDGLDALYLRRIRIIQTPWFALYLHHIMEEDHDPDPHDHPFNFWSIVLRGGYMETITYDRPRVSYLGGALGNWKALSFHKMSKHDFHRIVKILPNTWTLIFVGRRTKDWGYLVDGRVVQWQQYKHIGGM